MTEVSDAPLSAWAKAVEGWFHDYSKGLDTADAIEASFFDDWYQDLHKGAADPMEALFHAWNYVGTLNPDMQAEVQRLVCARPVNGGVLGGIDNALSGVALISRRLDRALEGCANREDVMSVDADLLLDLRRFIDGGLTELERQVHGLSARADLVDQRLQDLELGVIRGRVAEADGIPKHALVGDMPIEGRPNVICLCGSSRFVAAMAVLAWQLEKMGNIVMSLHLLPSWYTTNEDHQAEHEGVAEFMDDLHLRKIDLADEVVVVDVDGYIGESTAREIQYAQGARTPMHYLSKEPHLLAMLEKR